MSIKEKPLIDAVSRLGPLPGFLFDHPVFTGFFATLMCAVFGAVFIVFQIAGRGGVEAIELYDAALIGAACGLSLAAVTLLIFSVTGPREPEERKIRRQFIFGGVLAIVTALVGFYFADDFLREYVQNAGPIV